MHTYWQRFHLIQQSAEQAEQLCRTRHGADEVIEDTPTSLSTAVNTHNWKSVQVVNSHLVCDPTIRQPGFDLPRQRWSLLNCLRTEQGHCGACRRKWRDQFHCIRLLKLYACKGFRKRSYEPGSPCSVFSCFIQLYVSILLNK